MIIEIATAAAMYLAENVTTTAAQSDIPPMRPRAAQPRHQKQQQDPDPYAAMWDPNWISTITPGPELNITNTSANTPNPNVAKKPLK